MTQTIVVICTTATHADLDRVLGAMGEGYGGFANGNFLAATGSPNTITHHLLNWAAGSDALAAELVAMASSNDLPSIAPKLWGVGGEISAEDAQAAMDGLTVITYAGPPINMTQWRNNELAGLGLTWWVDPEA